MGKRPSKSSDPSPLAEVDADAVEGRDAWICPGPKLFHAWAHAPRRTVYSVLRLRGVADDGITDVGRGVSESFTSALI